MNHTSLAISPCSPAPNELHLILSSNKARFTYNIVQCAIIMNLHTKAKEGQFYRAISPLNVPQTSLCTLLIIVRIDAPSSQFIST